MPFVRGPDWGYQIFVICLILYPQFTAQPFLIWPWLRKMQISESVFWVWTLLFNGGCFCIWWSYYLACSTDPGGVPDGWVLLYSGADMLEADHDLGACIYQENGAGSSANCH